MNCLKVGDLIIRKAYLHICIIVSLFILIVNISYCITRSITAVYCFVFLFFDPWKNTVIVMRFCNKKIKK